MKNEEFVKLKHWLDAEITIIHIYLAVIFGVLLHNLWVWIGVGVYILISMLYAGIRLAYVAAKDKDYLRIPKI